MHLWSACNITLYTGNKTDLKQFGPQRTGCKTPGIALIVSKFQPNGAAHHVGISPKTSLQKKTTPLALHTLCNLEYIWHSTKINQKNNPRNCSLRQPRSIWSCCTFDVAVGSYTGTCAWLVFAKD